MGSPASDAALEQRRQALARMTQERVAAIYSTAVTTLSHTAKPSDSSYAITRETCREWHVNMRDLCLAVEEQRSELADHDLVDGRVNVDWQILRTLMQAGVAPDDVEAAYHAARHLDRALELAPCQGAEVVARVLALVPRRTRPDMGGGQVG